MEELLLGLVFDIFSGLCTALNTLLLIFLYLASVSTKVIDITKIIDNIYVLVSVIMIFYITVNLLTYLVTPDKLADKTAGGAKLLIKITITIAMLVLTPTAFALSRDFQTAVLQENILAKVILSTNTKMDDSTFLGTGQMISRVFVEAFITSKDGDNTEIMDTGFMQGETTSMIELRQIAQNTANYSFNWIMAIAATAILCLLVFGFLFDLAVRIIKLSFMEIIAPIPILSYPLNSKNGSFSKWLKQVGSTYAVLFIRLALIYFAVFIIREVCNNAADLGGNESNPVLKSFIIIGALLFVKQLPQLLSDIFGIKMDGKFSLNPMARIREVPLLGSAVQTAGAAVGGAVVGAGFAGREFRQNGGLGAFKNADGSFNMKAGLSNITHAFGTTGRAALFGGRAGYRQTSLMGTAIKDQKIDKAAYAAGASSVAQAYTGNSDASSGIADRIFNDMGTHLNQGTFQQNKTIALAEKGYNEELAKLTNYQDAEREIISNRDVSYSRMSNYQAQLTAKGEEIANFRTNMQTEISTRVANEASSIDAQIQQLSSNKDAMLQQQIDNYRASLPKGVPIRKSDVDAGIAQITQQFETNFNQTISNMQVEKANLRAKIENQVRLEETNLVNEYNSIDAKLNTERSTYESYNTQAAEMSSTIASQRESVANAKTHLDAEKDKLKAMHGPYQKNK